MLRECKLIRGILFSTLLVATSAAASSESIRLTYSERYWYPFLYTKDKQAGGLLYDILSKAFQSLKIKPLIEPVPIRRAIFYAQVGIVDCVIVGFRPEWRAFLDYPPGADKEIESPWRIMQVDYVVVSLAEESYEFEGDLNTLPFPVRILQEAPVIDELKKAGIRAEGVKEDIQNFMKLLRDQKGVIITTTVVAEMMERDSRFKGKIKIHATPVYSASYYLAFSKKSPLSREEKERIWKEIVRWRDDYVFMLQIFSQY